MNALGIASIASVLALAAVADLAAQQDTLVATGVWVRIWTAPRAGDPLTGSLKNVTSDSLVLELDDSGQSVALARADVAKLEVSQGRNDYALVGAGLGLLVGAAVGWEIGGDVGDIGDGVFVLLGITTGGAVLGAVIGSKIGGENWEEVPIDEIRVGLLPAADGVVVSASIRF